MLSFFLFLIKICVSEQQVFKFLRHNYFYNYLLNVCVFVYVETLIPWHMCEGHKTTCRSQFSSFTTRVLRTEVRLPGLVTSAFSHLNDPKEWVLFMTCPYTYITLYCWDSHPSTIVSCPHSAFTMVCAIHTWRQEVNVMSSSIAHHFIFETGSVTESEGHNWLDWPMSPGDLPVSTSQEG